MPIEDKNTSWAHIQEGVAEAEKLIIRKNYNASMVKCRQTLEFMIKQLAVRASIQSANDLKPMIDALMEKGWISKSTCSHYHTIRKIGNRAVHEEYNDESAARQACQLLSQEAKVFSENYNDALKKLLVEKSQEPSSKKLHAPQLKKARGKTPEEGMMVIDASLILKLLVPALSVVLVILVVNLLKPPSKKVSSDENEKIIASQDISEGSGERASGNASIKYKTTAILNIRSEPSTDSEVLGKLAAGESVEYISRYDEDWVIIEYDGKRAYIASQYLTEE